MNIISIFANGCDSFAVDSQSILCEWITFIGKNENGIHFLANDFLANESHSSARMKMEVHETEKAHVQHEREMSPPGRESGNENLNMNPYSLAKMNMRISK